MAKLTISKDGCKGCGLCVMSCPKKILKVSDKISNKNGYFIVEIIDESACIACANCAIMCPDIAITIEK